MSAVWWKIENEEAVLSPSLLVYPERVEANIRRMLAEANGPERLRPHVKTHKSADVTKLLLAHGITKFKCATIAEAEMLARCAAPDVLLALQPVGPNIQRLLQLVKTYPATRFSTVVDQTEILRQISKQFSAAGQTIDLYLDVDCGMHRTGIAPGPAAVDLYMQIAALPGIRQAGLHVYDGHITESDLSQRKLHYQEAFSFLQNWIRGLEASSTPARIIAGGSPTFPLHATRANYECSPGTSVFWDYGYSQKYPDQPYAIAAAVLTRVISVPGAGVYTLDLGHKAIAAENPHPRVYFPDVPDATFLSHSEEHLVIKTEKSLKIGDCLYGFPRHICPTVALHSHLQTVVNGRVVGSWPVTARDRMLQI